MSEYEYNPKLERLKAQNRRRALAFEVGEISDPIGAEINDPEVLKRFYRRWPLIPYAGTVYESNDGLLSFFDASRNMSPTQGACHNSIKAFLFGGRMQVVEQENADFKVGDDPQPIPEALQREYIDFLSQINTEQSHTEIAKNAYDELAANGNVFLEVVHTATAGVKSSAYYLHPAAHCRYWATLKGQPLMLMVSEIFHEDYLRRYPPRVLPVFPNYAQEEDGTRRTIIHIKNGNYRWYGRPAYAGAWIDIFSEYKERHYLTKAAASNFTGQGVMEVEEDDPETSGLNLEDEDAVDAGYSGIAQRFDENFTASSDDPQTFLFMTRPFGAKPVHIYEFKPYTNENFYEKVGSMHRASIIENWAWSERLLGNAVAEGFSTDTFVSELRVKEISTLSYYRDVISQALSLVFTECAKWAEQAAFMRLGVELPTAVDKMLGLKSSNMKELIDAYGVGVRAGAITSTEDDEEFFREKLSLTPVNAAVKEAWREDGGTRRPITLKASVDSESELADNPQQDPD